jgi:hypothetical protein
MLDQIEDAWRMFNNMCHLEMWSLGMPSWYWDICNAHKGRRRWNTYFDKLCNTKDVWSNFLTFVGVQNACASVVVIESRVGVSMTRSLKVDAIQMSLWRVAWLTLSQMWECWGCLEIRFNKIPFPDVVTWGIWNVGKGRRHSRTFPKNATQRCAIKLCYHLWDVRIVMLEDDRCPHDQIIQIGWDSDVFVGSSLVDMYAKCGTVWECLKSVQQDVILDVVTEGACKM